ncbi:MAG: hypothetical protein LC749_14130 [Actinobacteria bacterium]|nr:hypothetical protein [Actinomycetota bacterium]
MTCNFVRRVGSKRGFFSGLLGKPIPTRFGIVANPTTQFAYLDHDHNWTRWPLPLL